MPAGGALSLRRLEPAAFASAFGVMRELQRHLDLSTFLERLERQRAQGFELVGAYREERLIGLLGFRPVLTLARGDYLHVDDLIVLSGYRGRGIGQRLMAFALEEARRRGFSEVFLDSGPDAVAFYERLGFVLHWTPSMHRLLELPISAERITE